MKIFLIAFVSLLVWAPCSARVIPESDGPKILKDDGAEEVFVEMLGHWIHSNNQKAQPRYLVVILSSVGCPGCYTFRLHKQDDFVNKYRKKADIYSVDYFLEKADLTAMALVAALPEHQQNQARELLLGQQQQWLGKDTLIVSLQTLLSKNGIAMNEDTRHKWNELRVQELNQRKFLDTICKIKYLPYFIVVDRKKKQVVICDTLEVAEETLQGSPQK